MNKAVFTRKAVDIEEVKERADREEAKCEYIVEKVIELPEKDYLAFADDLLADNETVRANKEKMFIDGNAIWHCILVKAEGGKDGLLVESEGYSYARYTAYLPDCGGIGHAQ